jgi:MYXO-CTERM domain-containing protein
MRLSLRFVTALTLTGTVALGGCSAAPPTGPVENVGSTAQAITTSSILSRADEWVTAQLLYCQSPNGADDSIDPSCSPVCQRQSNSAWDPYRSDCSGFVSWAWGLPAPGNTTSTFAPADTSVSYVIQGSDLQPGDALNIPGDHIVLFVSWVTVGTEANFYEEPGCSANPPYAHAFTSAVTISGSSVDIAYEGATFTAIRYTGVTGGSDAGTGTGTGGVDSGDGTGTLCSVGGESGVCMDTGACAAEGNHTSTPGYCPGADNIQCCTATSTGQPTPDAGMVEPADSGVVEPFDSGVVEPADSGTLPPGSGTGSSAETECAAAGGECVPVAVGMCNGYVGQQSCGAGVASGCCLPGTAPTGTGPGGAVLDGGPIGTGSGVGTSSSTGATSSTGAGVGGSSGCSVSASRSNAGGDAWLFGLGVLGFVWATRRRRAV